MTDGRLVPAGEVRRELIVLNSRFIATLAPVSDVAAAKALLARVRQEFADASHHVPAYLVGGDGAAVAHCSDDGEPAGTAGRPVLAVLRGSGLGDAGLVVTRYFGGTLLGAGGLVRAYTEAAQLAVRAAGRARKVPGQRLLLAIPYNWLERVRRLVAAHSGSVRDESFAADVTLTLDFPAARCQDFRSSLRDLSGGQLTAEPIEVIELHLPVDPS